MPAHLPICLINFENGGRISPGSYRFDKLGQIFKNVATVPVLIVICEAKEWGYWGNGPLLSATQELSEHFDVPYQSKLTHLDRGDFGPAVLFDPNLLSLSYWGDAHSSVPGDKRNLARFKVRGTTKEFEVLAEHWDFTSGRARMPYAERVMSYGSKNIPVLLAGDFNETASGLHLPQINWSEASIKTRRHKGRQLPDGTWTAHTEAVDLLIGESDSRLYAKSGLIARRNGAGFHMVAELAAATGTPQADAFSGTTKGSKLLIDMLLVNDAWQKQGGVVPGTYRVIGNGIHDWPSDHYMVEATLPI